MASLSVKRSIGLVELDPYFSKDVINHVKAIFEDCSQENCCPNVCMGVNVYGRINFWIFHNFLNHVCYIRSSFKPPWSDIVGMNLLDILQFIGIFIDLLWYLVQAYCWLLILCVRWYILFRYLVPQEWYFFLQKYTFTCLVLNVLLWFHILLHR